LTLGQGEAGAARVDAAAARCLSWTMSELDDAIAALERAVARLEAAEAGRLGEAAHDERVQEIATAIAARVDLALARIEQVLGGDG